MRRAKGAVLQWVQVGVLDKVKIAGVIEGLGKGLGQADALVELADGQQPGVAGELARRRLDDDRQAEKVEDLRPGGWYNPALPPRLQKQPGASADETHPQGEDSVTRSRGPGELVLVRLSQFRWRR